MVAWERGCRAKNEGGLGVRELATQNACLLLKMLHRLHTTRRPHWAAWIWSSADGRSILKRGELAHGEHRASVAKLLQLYRTITRVTVEDGQACSFWWDSWLPCGPVAVAYPALFSHATDVEATVWQVRRHGLTGCLVPRLTRAGVRDLQDGWALLVAAAPGGGDDKRQLRHAAAPHEALSSSAAYRLLRFGGVRAGFADMIWGARIPSRVQFFSWLLVQRRIHTRDVLLRKCIVAAVHAGCPLCAAPLETADHMLFACPFSIVCWEKIDIAWPEFDSRLDLIAQTNESEHRPLFMEIFLTGAWSLWKERNNKHFRGVNPSTDSWLTHFKGDFGLLQYRVKEAQRSFVTTFCDSLA